MPRKLTIWLTLLGLLASTVIQPVPCYADYHYIAPHASQDSYNPFPFQYCGFGRDALVLGGLALVGGATYLAVRNGQGKTGARGRSGATNNNLPCSEFSQNEVSFVVGFGDVEQALSAEWTVSLTSPSGVTTVVADLTIAIATGDQIFTYPISAPLIGTYTIEVTLSSTTAAPQRVQGIQVNIGATSTIYPATPPYPLVIPGNSVTQSFTVES